MFELKFRRKKLKLLMKGYLVNKKESIIIEENDNLNLLIYSAANFCFNKGLCMIWDKGTLREHK